MRHSNHNSEEKVKQITTHERSIDHEGRIQLLKEVQTNQGNYRLKWKQSFHAQKRASQRGFTYTDILMAMDFAETYSKQGLLYYVVLKKKLPKSVPSKIQEKLNNMVIITNGEGELITCYKSDKASKNIRKKRKNLSKIHS